MPPRRERLTHRRFLSKAEALDRIATLKGAVFPDDDAEKRAARMARAILHPEAFDQDYLPHYFNEPPAEFHQELYQILEHSLLAAVEAPRGHAKSTVITFAYSLHQLSTGEVILAWNEGRLEKEDPRLYAALRAALLAEGRSPSEQLRYDPFIVIGSCTQPQAEDFTTAIKLELEGNPRIIGDWGELALTPGKNYPDFVTASGIRCMAVGMRVSRRGLKHRQYRPTLWIIDDPDDEKTIGNPKIRRKQIKYLVGMVRPAMQPKWGRVFVIANETHLECLVATIYRDGELPEHEQRFVQWTKRRFVAIDEAGDILWPQRFPREVLEGMRREDEELFETEFQNNPPSGKDKPFKRLVYYSRADFPDTLPLPKVMWLDPSLGETETSDWQALVVIRHAVKQGLILVHRCELWRLPPRDLAQSFNDVYAEEKPDCAGIEGIGFQRLLEVLIAMFGNSSGLFPAVETLNSQKDGKDLRIRSLASLIRDGTIRFPDDGSCRAGEKQLLAYPDGKKDWPDTLEMAVRRLRQGLSQVEQWKGIRHVPGRASLFASGAGWC